jgi:hypothetical protein
MVFIKMMELEQILSDSNSENDGDSSYFDSCCDAVNQTIQEQAKVDTSYSYEMNQLNPQSITSAIISGSLDSSRDEDKIEQLQNRLDSLELQVKEGFAAILEKLNN